MTNAESGSIDTGTIRLLLNALGIAVAGDDPRLAGIAQELTAQAHFSALIERALADAATPAEEVVHAFERFDPSWAEEVTA